MSKRDYEAIAASIKARRDLVEEEVTVGHIRFTTLITLARMARDLADVFEASNPRFDRDKFLEACGL